MPRCSVTIILGLWCSLLAGPCRAAAARKTTPAKKAAPRKPPAATRPAASGDLGRLAAGVHAYREAHYPAAIAALNLPPQALPNLADYTAFYRAAARLESGDSSLAPADLAAVHRGAVASPLAGRAWVLEARVRVAANGAAAAVKLLREHYAALPQPDGDMEMATASQAAGDLAHAAEFYQRVYYQYPDSGVAPRAGTALASLYQSMGSAYPVPPASQMLARGDRLLEARLYREARAEFQSLAHQLSGADRDTARVRAEAADYLGGRARTACVALRALDLAPSEAAAERLYRLSECARSNRDDDAMLSAVAELGREYRHSPWRLKALMNAASRFLRDNQPQQYLALYGAAWDDFPAQPAAAQAHWQLTFDAYLHRRPDAGDLLRRHLLDCSSHPSAPAALYFLGRWEERQNEPGGARAIYQKLVAVYPNYYYGVLARQRLAEVAAAAAPARVTQFLAGVPFPPREVPAAPTPAALLRVERARLLRTAGLDDLADAELRFGAATDGHPRVLALEMAREAPAAYQGLRVMKRYSGDYLAVPLDRAPAEFWRALFPVPWRDEIERLARANGLDPSLVAALIRQESEFNPGAVSRAAAYGLMQVRIPTARPFARRLGMRGVSSAALKQPVTNLKIGTAVLKSMLDAKGARVEATLASYNAGPSRAASWITWHDFAEPAEFIEAIPITETHDYVQAVMRNAEIYRQLYAR